MNTETNQEINETSPQKSADVINMNTRIKTAAQDAPAQWDGIAILGSHPATIAQAPFSDPRWRMYACSPHNIEHRTLPHVHEWFEVHDQAAHQTRQYEYLRRLEDNQVAQNPPNAEVIWVRDKAFCARGRDFRMYPEKEMLEQWGPFFFTSSIAYMLAKAIVDAKNMDIPRIGIWGVMQASENEYTYQRPGIQYFIWRAEELGIEVIAPRESRLFEPQKVEF